MTGPDPSETCYKPFSFAAEGGVGALDDASASTASLWLAHKKKRQSTRGELMKLEAELVRRVGKAGGKASPDMFLEAVQQERAVLERCS